MTRPSSSRPLPSTRCRWLRPTRLSRRRCRPLPHRLRRIPPPPRLPTAPPRWPPAPPVPCQLPEGVQHLSSPDNPPPGTTSDEPVGPQSGPNVTYLKELWHAIQTQQVSKGDALLALTQRPLDTPVTNDPSMGTAAADASAPLLVPGAAGPRPGSLPTPHRLSKALRPSSPTRRSRRRRTGASTPVAAALTASTSRAQVSNAAPRWSAATAATRAASPMCSVPTRWLAAIARTPVRRGGHLGEHLEEGLLGQWVSRVLQAHHLTAAVMVAHHPGEPDHGAGRVVRDEVLVLRQRDGAIDQCGAHDPGHRGWSPPASWSSAWSSTSARTARPSRTPPGEPGRLTTRVRPATPHTPRDRTEVGHLGQPGAADGVGEAGNLIIQHAEGGFRGGVGRRDAGSPGGDHHVDTLAERRAQGVADRTAVDDHDRGGHIESALGEPADDDGSAAILVDAGGRAGGGDDDAGRASHVGRVQRPVLPPSLRSTRMSIQARGRVHGLDHVEQGERGDADRGQRLHLHAGAVGGAHRGRQPDLALPDREVDVDAGQGQLDDIAGSGRWCVWRPVPRPPGRSRGRHPWADPRR